MSAFEAVDYVFDHLRTRDPRLWRGSRVEGSARLTRAEAETLAPVEFLKTFQLKGVGRDSQAGLLGWLEERYPLDCRPDIPTPREMLDIQCEGRRFVTLMRKPEEQFVVYGRHPGALEFLLHDLEHAHKFFGNEDQMRGQIAFFRRLRDILPRLEPLMDAQFSGELDYLMADMNSHPVHLLKYLKAIVLNACQRRGTDYEEFCMSLFDAWGMPPEVREAAVRINSPGLETPADQITVAGFFTF